MPSPAPAEILAARRASGLTQTQAAGLVGVKLRAWQYWEAGERTIPTSAWELFLIKTEGRKKMSRTEDQWWAWHDADQSRWSTDLSDAESRCAAWVAGKSEDGPQK